jgi:putative salt-induced outer membrane protein YdiY
VRRSLFLAGLVCFLVRTVQADQVTLKNGDRLTGAVVKSDGKTLLIKTELTGDVTVPWNAVTSLTSSQALHVEVKGGKTVAGKVETQEGKLEVAAPNGAVTEPREAVVAIRNEAEQKSYEKSQHPHLTDFWSGLLDMGLNETRGNSALLAFSVAAKAARVAPRDKITLYTNSVYATDNTTPPGRTTAHTVQGGARLDYDLTPRFFVFGLADFTYDEFQHLDLRSVYGGGFGLHAVKSKTTTLDVFGGGDYERESFSPNPPLVPTGVTRNTAEVLAGEELNWKLNNRVTLSERFSAFPNMSDLGQYRFQLDASAATKLKNWLSWQITFGDRYISNPLPGLKSNDELIATGLRLNFGRGIFQ